MVSNWYYTLLIAVPGFLGLSVIWLFFRPILSNRRRTIVISTLIMFTYLVLLDRIAVYLLHIWSFRPDTTTNIALWGLLPEEYLLHFITSLLTTSAITILIDRNKKLN